MGFCINCKFLGDSITGRLPNYVCKNEENALVNFITGEIMFSNCVEKNRFGQCRYYEVFKPEEEPTETPSDDPTNGPIDEPSDTPIPENPSEDNDASTDDNNTSSESGDNSDDRTENVEGTKIDSETSD